MVHIKAFRLIEMLALMSTGNFAQAAIIQMDMNNVSILRHSLSELAPRERCEKFCRGINDMVAGESSAELNLELLTKAAENLDGCVPSLGKDLRARIDMLQLNNESAEIAPRSSETTGQLSTKPPEGRMNALGMENVLLRDQVEKLVKVAEILVGERDDLVRDGNALDDEKGQITARNITLKAEIDALERQKQSLSDEIHRLSRLNAAHRALRDRLHKDNADLVGKIEALESQLKVNTKTQDEEKKNLAFELIKIQKSNKEFPQVISKMNLESPGLQAQLEEKLLSLKGQMVSAKQAIKNLEAARDHMRTTVDGNF